MSCDLMQQRGDCGQSGGTWLFERPASCRGMPAIASTSAPSRFLKDSTSPRATQCYVEMDLHVKMLLILAAYPLRLVLTGNVRSCLGRLGHDALEDDHPLAPTTSRLESPRQDGVGVQDDGLRAREQVAHSRNNLLIPDELKNMPGRIEAMDTEYESLAQQLDKIPALVTPLVLQECQVPEEEFTRVHQELRNYVKRYLLQDGHSQGGELAESHSNIATGSSLQNPSTLPSDVQQVGSRKPPITELAKIIRSINFPAPSRYKNMLENSQQEVGRAKTAFEISVFKTLNYCYRFHLITKKEMNIFFQTPEILQLTARHLPDLFSLPKDAYYGRQTFVPDLFLILNDMRTMHLHRLVSDLDDQVQGDLMFKTLQISIQTFEEVRAQFPEISRSSDSISIKFLLQEDFLSKFKQLGAPGSNRVEDQDVWKTIVNAVNLFKGFPREPRQVSPHHIERAEVLLNYYFLRFIQTYGNQAIQKELQESSHSLLREQLVLARAGLILRHRLDEYLYLFAYPQEAGLVFSTPKLLEEEQEHIRKDIESKLRRLTASKENLPYFSNKQIRQQRQEWQDGNALASFIESLLPKIPPKIEPQKARALGKADYLGQSNSWLVPAGTSSHEGSAGTSSHEGSAIESPQPTGS